MEGGKWPSVTVVVPTRNRPELLRRAVDSIVEQDYVGAITVLVVFDQSTPDLDMIRQQPQRIVDVLSNARAAGLAGARNTGILAARGELVAFCDDDDSWRPGKLASQVNALRDAPEHEMVTCGIAVQYGDSTAERPLDRSTITFSDLLKSRLTELHPSTFLFRRQPLVNCIGLVDEDIPGSYAEDYELLLRAARRHPVLHVAQVQVDVLWHQQSFFAARWTTIAEALSWLLDAYPEFAAAPAGRARITGQIAFACAASGRRRDAYVWAWRTLRCNKSEARAYLAVAVATGMLTPARVLTLLHRRGRGI